MIWPGPSTKLIENLRWNSSVSTSMIWRSTRSSFIRKLCMTHESMQQRQNRSDIWTHWRKDARVAAKYETFNSIWKRQSHMSIILCISANELHIHTYTEKWTLSRARCMIHMHTCTKPSPKKKNSSSFKRSTTITWWCKCEAICSLNKSGESKSIISLYLWSNQYASMIISITDAWIT